MEEGKILLCLCSSLGSIQQGHYPVWIVALFRVYPGYFFLTFSDSLKALGCTPWP